MRTRGEDPVPVTASLPQTIELGNPEALSLVLPLTILALYLHFRSSRTIKLLSSALGVRKKSSSLGLAAKLLVVVLFSFSAASPALVYVDRVPVSLDNIDLLAGRSVLHVVVLDVSRSMSYAEGVLCREDLALAAVKEYVAALHKGDRVMFLLFSRNVSPYGPFAPSEAARALENVTAEGKYSAVGDALLAALTYASLSPRPSVVILLTDGAWNYGSDPLETAKAYAESRVPLVVVRVGSDPRGSSLPVVAEHAHGKYFELDRFSAEAIGDLVEELRRTARYLALSARGEAYVEVKRKDYSIQLYLLLTALCIVLAVVRDGV